MTEIDDGFDRLRVDHTLWIVDELGLTVRSFHAFELRCHTASRFLIHRYTWTGGGVESVPRIGPTRRQLEDLKSSNPAPTLHGPVLRGEARERILVVDMGRVFEPKEPAYISVEHMFVDSDGDFEPRLSHAVVGKRREVNLAVILPSPADTHSLAEHPGANHRSPTRLEPAVEYDEHGKALYRYTYPITKPEKGVRYKIEWKKAS